MSLIEHPALGKLIITKCLGAGSFSKVWLARSLSFNFSVALKQIRDKDSIGNELVLGSKAFHPLVADLYDLFEYKGNSYLMQQYVEGSTLLDYVNSRGPMREDLARMFFAQMLAVVDHLHNTLNIVHRDLKCENIIIDSSSNIHLIDFGFAREGASAMSTDCGSPDYMAPEVIAGLKYDKSVDIWALGVTLYAMTVGTLPFDNKNIGMIFHNILHTTPSFPDMMSIGLVDLLTKMLEKNPKKRITLKEILEHPWLTFDSSGHKVDINWEAINSLSVQPEAITSHIAKMKSEKKTQTEENPSLDEILFKIVRRLFLNQKMQHLLSEILVYSTMQIARYQTVPLPSGMLQRKRFAQKSLANSPLILCKKLKFSKRSVNTRSNPSPQAVLYIQDPKKDKTKKKSKH